jgi:pimeloyl-ACP methyl ester carboxylesterase
MLRATVIVLSCLFMACLAQDYSQPGPYAIRTSRQYTFDMPSSTECDKERNYCEVTVEVTFPTQAGAYPLIIFNNGFGVNMRMYRSYAEYYVSWGYTAIMWNMDEGAFGGVSHRSRGLESAYLPTWAAQQSASPSSDFYGKVDLTQGVIQTGHSLGGKTAVLAAIYDPRVVGFILFDPVDCPAPMPPGLPYDQDTPAAALMINQTKAIGVFIGAELGDIGELIPCAPVECNYQRYYGNATSPAWEVTAIGAGHAQWTDNQPSGGNGGCTNGPARTENVIWVSQTLAIAWAERAVRGKDITYWMTEWIEERRQEGLVNYRIK